MKPMKTLTTISAIYLALSSGAVQATLFDRGGGLLYDDVLNITWLQDANYAKTSGYDTDGRMEWGEAKTWTGNLVYHDSVRNIDYSDWRVASNTPIGVDWNYDWSTSGNTDYGYNIISPHSEMSYMYYVNLGLEGYYSPTMEYQSNFGIFGNGTIGGEANVELVSNLQSGDYWSGTETTRYSNATYSPSAWNFWMDYGVQVDSAFQSSQFYVWAVRDGDVAPIPEPETYVMFMAGLGLMGFITRRRKNGQA